MQTQKHKRTIQNRVISVLNGLRYYLAEPALLMIARKKYEYLYRNPDDNPLISVYIPTYNRAKILTERSMPSVLNQSYKNLELVIIGDCCTDNTAELISKINDPRIRFYNIPKRAYRYPPTVENHWFAGPVVACNKALEMVRGKWLSVLGDDDILDRDHLKLLLRFAQDGDYEFVSAAYISERHGKRIIVDVKNEKPRIGGAQTWLYRSYLRFFKYNINCWRKSWNRVNDLDLQDRMFKAGVRMGFLDRVVAYVLPRPGETTVGLETYKLTEEEKRKQLSF